MKRQIFLSVFATVALVGGLFYSCSKEAAQPAEELMLKVAQAPVEANVTIDASENPTPVNEPVTITGTVTNKECGQIKIEEYVYNNTTLMFEWISVENFVDVKPLDDTPANNLATYTFTPTSVGTHTYRAAWNPGGGGYNCGQGGGGAAFSSTLGLTVVNPCEVPLNIAAERVGATQISTNVWEFTARYTVKACEDFKNLKVQGGLTAGSTFMSATTGYTKKDTKQNFIINWQVAEVKAGDVLVYEVVFRRTLKSACTEYDITGAWSAKAWQLKDVDDGLGNLVPTMVETVAGYDNKLIYKTPCPVL